LQDLDDYPDIKRLAAEDEYFAQTKVIKSEEIDFQL
jgi:hypothetical protein